MKKAVFILMFIIECGAVFAELVYTSEGYYEAEIDHQSFRGDFEKFLKPVFQA